MDDGKITHVEFQAITEAILELSDIGAALQNQNIDWFKQNQSLSVYYGELCMKLAAMQKRLSGKCGVQGF